MKRNTFKGKFIVLEGLDGSGQSTQAGLLKDFLIKEGIDVFLTKEPTRVSESGKKIRNILDGDIKVGPKEVQELMVQDRKEHLRDLIIPALKEGKIVISDRYFFSTFAFGTADGNDLEWLIEINKEFLYPDFTFLLKVNPKVCIDRIIKRGKKIALFEKEAMLTKVWKTYNILPDRFSNIHLINGEQSIEKVFEDIKKLTINHLNI